MTHRSRLKSAAASVALVLVSGIAYADNLPKLKQGMDFVEARALLLDAGWQGLRKYPPPNDFGMVGHVFYDLGITEVVDCAGTGMAPCKFIYKNAEGKYLTVFTYGDEPKLDTWQFGLK